MKSFDDIFDGGDLRSIGNADQIAGEVCNQKQFDTLFEGLSNSDRKVVMRTADAIEKITKSRPEYLNKHKNKILTLCGTAEHIELKWHLALLVSRLTLTEDELGIVWSILTAWAMDKKESRIVRVNSIQGLYNLLQINKELEHDFALTTSQMFEEEIPSVNARIKKLRRGGK